MFGYVAQFLYEGDSPLAERRAAALSLDPTLLAELLGRGEGAGAARPARPRGVGATESELQRLGAGTALPRRRRTSPTCCARSGAQPFQAILERCRRGHRPRRRCRPGSSTSRAPAG